ncbi:MULTISPECIES: NAD-binding protein [unclassified Micromonospora]|uniref:NAD-binding protein n=1 Tax=unclassified Micromonospora TaxID=2617518 RepID=UPI0022B6CFAF|nr:MULTISPECIES: NAD-binding protein [unclassified Micromonospora]MCZ7423171.1 NAD-binding protein [Verrucosispora sp. WMMA2121]WBB90863.1 NAD-binding protein [Verrucosispora sp. WMMC514]
MLVPESGSPVQPEPEEPRRFVICGDDSLAYRLADELTNRHGGRVTVILRSRTSRYGRRIARLPGVRFIVAERPDADAYQTAGLGAADALALVDRNDVANIEAALQAHDLHPTLRIVVRMFNTGLSRGLDQLPYCTVLSDGALAAPAFVSAAVGQATPRHGLRDGTMFVAGRDEVREHEVVCGLAISRHGDEVEVLPARQHEADLVLAAVAPWRPETSRRRPMTHGYPLGTIAGRVWRRIRVVLGVFLGLLLVAAAVLALSRPATTWSQAFFEAVLATLGGADVEPTATGVEKVTLVVLTIASIALIPLLTGAVVDAVIKVRLEVADGSLPRRASGHVIVVGLGGVGSHVVEGLHALGVDVIAIDRSADARGVSAVRELRIPLIVGDASRRETLLAASLATSRALVVLTADDVTNLETALVGRAVRADLRVVLRLFDGDFADQVQRAFDLTISRSVSYLAVPSFVARMLGHELEAIPVARRVLLVAETTVGERSLLARMTVGDLRRPGEAWLLRLTNLVGSQLPATVADGRRLRPGEKITVVATRAGLARLMAEAAARPDALRHIVPHE